MRLLSGIKPTRVHLGHLLSIIEYLRNKQYIKDFNIDPEDVYALIGDIHKISTSIDMDQNNEHTQVLANVMQIINTKYYIQSETIKEYFYAYYLISALSSNSDVDKIYKINYTNNTVNNFIKMSYPVLMATDIIMLQPCKVLVASDQIHNIRFAKKIVQQINKFIPNASEKICVDMEILDLKIADVSDGVSKMSTSSSNMPLYLDLPDEKIRSIVFTAVTQTNMPQTISDCEFQTKNLYTIYSKIEKISIEQTIELFKATSFAIFKEKLYLSIIKLFNYYRQQSNNKLNAIDSVREIHKINYQKLIKYLR